MNQDCEFTKIYILFIMLKLQNKVEFLQAYQAGVRNFQQTILTAVNLTGNNFEQINLDESNLIEINWSNCSLNQASLRKAYLGLSSFQNCCLSKANFQEANLAEVNLVQANLEGADLRAANLQKANLQGANLKGAKLDNASLVGAVYDSQTIFDSDFAPQVAGMILANPDSSQAKVKTNSDSQKNKGSLRKILSWGRSAKSMMPT